MRTVRFAELSYARPDDPPFKRWVIRTIESLSGRERLADLYDYWRHEIFGKSDSVFTEMLNLIEVQLEADGRWPPESVPDTPIVMVANHPYGIGDGIAFLALAERLGRPFRVVINNDLLKVPEIRPYSLPISFEETKEAVALNLQTRKEAVRLLKEGVTIVIFPAGGVATARKGLGRAEDLPWKMFTARLIQSAQASVIPVYFDGQNGRLFHLVSQFSLTLRTSLLIREFQRLYGKRIRAWIGETMTWEQLAAIDDRKVLLEQIHRAVFSLDPSPRRRRTPGYVTDRY
ncbi:lysophospholipid acyltransferase family protein [Oricola sp.]|uniref:lysophospholipid acyltransferase family protein n=1 Tax=Oricola sp. TaxID=1979950 RepID=UPI0025EA16DB|nr:lysophospholipid acyltransferase family protein [Oricola sp.]MCI5073744.1 lysophospholipid acyltransferase family protein [Oricola sp.]